MGQDELVLRVAPDPDPTKTSLQRDPNPQENNAAGKRSHSRESSGASNLSVRFTTNHDGSSSPRALVTGEQPFRYNSTLKPVSSSLRKRDDERRRKHRARSRVESKSDPDDLIFNSDSNDDDSLSDRLSPDSPNGTSHENRMFHGDSKSQNSDYGSLRNTPSDNFVPTAVAGSSSGPGGPYQVSNPEPQHRGHQRNDSEIQIGNDAYQTRPLLENHDSSSDDDAGGYNNGYTRKKSRHRGGGGGAVQIDIPPEDGATNDDSDSDEEDSVPAEPIKTLLAAIFLLFAWIATTTSLALTHERVPDTAPLPDILLDNFNYQSWGLDASEILIMVSVWTAFLVSIFHRHRFIVLRRIFLLVGIHYYYRAITMFITVLPKSNVEYTCAPKLNETTAAEIVARVLKLLSGMGLSINGKHVYCGDYIYSGHTMILTMAYFVIREYSPKSWFLLHWASFVTSFAGVVMLLLARGHYSIDVIIAYWITTRIWWIYHTLANNINLKGDVENPQNYLNNMWWWYLFRYFEKNVPCNLPRRFGWPIPRRLRRWKPSAYFRRIRSSRFANSPSPTISAVAVDNPERTNP